MTSLTGLLRRLRLRYLLFLLLLCSGILPVTISGVLLVRHNRELLETQEKAFLTRSAAAQSREVSDYLVGLRRQLLQVGNGLLTLPGEGELGERLRAPWVGGYLQGLLRSNSSVLEIQALDRNGAGPRLAPADLAGATEKALDTVFREATGKLQPAFLFAALPGNNEPVVALSVPIVEAGRLRLVIQAVARLYLLQSLLGQQVRGDVETFLVDRLGQVIWSSGADRLLVAAVANSNLVKDFARKPLSLTAQYEVEIDGRKQTMLAQVSPVEETGWGVLVHKPASAAFQAARQMVWTTALSTALLALLALVVAVTAARLVSNPIQRLAETTHEIAAGNFSRRLDGGSMAFELAALAHDFNRMSGHVQDHIEHLRQAANANQELFISAIRAFAAAIDAKDPYTRGHSERVADVSRAIASHLGQSVDFQERLWIGALLHDIGKIGIDDRVLKKGGVLTPEEYQEMKAHPAKGFEILTPLEALRESLPAVRWHHENWNGRGYPDGLKGDHIPLMARIVAVADCFDAITTNRPYQKAYDAPFAVETIKKLAGTRFDAKVVTAFLRAFEAGDVGHGEDRPGADLPMPAAASQ